jgi:aminodeoxyfutalosine deaminase
VTISDVLRAMPKAELHVHLEGTISPDTLWALATRNQVSLPVGSLAELRALYRFESFDTFLTLWMAMCRCLKREADYEQMVDAFLEDAARVNLRYAEAHFTPYNHERFGFGGKRALDLVTRRLEQAQAAGGPVVRLILDIPSESVPESGPYTAALLEEEANPVVVAIGLGGPEEGFPRTLVRHYFERARRAGYPAVAHAGETAGPEHVRQAVMDLKVRRVQHGVRAVEDAAVVKMLAEREVCCDVALTSNTFLTVYRELSAHPLRQLLAAGVPVTLSTDDPPFFGTDLVAEYRRARDEMGLSVAELWQLNLNGLRHGLADVAVRRRLLREFESAGQSLGLVPPAD